MAKIDDAELERLISAIKNRNKSDHSRVKLINSSKMASKRRVIQKELENSIVNAGVDLTKTKNAIKQYQSELKDALEEGKTRVGKAFANLEEGFSRSIEARRNALDQLSPLVPRYEVPIPIQAPFFISARPLDILIDSHIEAGKSWAKIKANYTNRSSFDRLSFYFLWDNPDPNGYALINVATSLLPKGICVATGNTALDLFQGGKATLIVRADLWFHEGPWLPAGASGDEKEVAWITAQGGGFTSGETGEANSEAVFGVYYLGRDYWSVPP